MKHFVRLSVLAVAVSVAAMAIYSYAQNDERGKTRTDNEGHVLISQWKEYAKAEKADLPGKKEQILDEIINESKSGGYAVDFYDACQKWYNAVVIRDWKRREEAVGRISDEAAAFGNALVSYLLAENGVIRNSLDVSWYDANISGGRETLLQTRTSGLYSFDGNMSGLPGFVADNISNDYEYILWSLSCTERYHSSAFWKFVRPRAKKDLAEYLDGSYPSGAYLEFMNLRDSLSSSSDFAEKEAALKAFEVKYGGKAIGLLAAQEILEARKNELDRRLYQKNNKPVSDDYRALRADCEAFEQKRKSFSGKESVIAEYCTGVKDVIESLDSKDISAMLDDASGNEIIVLLKNLETVDVKLYKDQEGGELLHKAVLGNSSSIYYLKDTLRYALPGNIDDGEYVIEFSGKGAETLYFCHERNTVSLAYRTNSDGTGIYAAGYRTGEPVRKADIEFTYKGKTVKTVEGFEFNGFTSIQTYLDEIPAAGTVYLGCSFKDENGILRKSNDIAISRGGVKDDNAGGQLACTVISDRSAYNPGDTVKFKTVLYSSCGDGYSVLPEGFKVNVSIYGRDRESLGNLDLETNDFGSAAGEFVIPEDAAGGRYTVEVEGKDVSGCTWITVDDFVLPTYTLEFDKDTSLYYNGGTIAVKGRIMSYSGHPVSAARLSYNVRLWSSDAVSGEITPLPGGRFEFSFKTDGSRESGLLYNVTVKAVDQTGETLEWNTSYRTEPYVWFDLNLAERAEASISGGSFLYNYGEGRDRNSSDFAVLDGEVAHFTASVYSSVPSGKVSLPVEVRYMVLKDGKTVDEGHTLAGKEFAIDLSSRPSGVYVVDAEAVYVRPDGKRKVMGYTFSLLKISEADSRVDSDVDFFCRVCAGGRIAVQVGSTSGPEWIVVELYGDKMQLLRSEIVYLDGVKGKNGSVKLIEYGYMDEYPDQVLLQLFSFKAGKSRVNSYDFWRKNVVKNDLPLEFLTFTDKSSPREECFFGVRTLPGVECAVSVFDVSTETIARNSWRPVYRRSARPVPVNVGYVCGSSYGFMDKKALNGMSAGLGARLKSSVTDSPAVAYGVMTLSDAERVVNYEREDEVSVEEYAAVEVEDLADAGDAVRVRDDFANTLAFIPFLRSDENGNIAFKVNTSDKLSTYCVQLFAHNRDMDNAVLRRDMVVTMPVKVGVVQPQFLYGGDIYRLKASVSNGSEDDLEGTLYLYIYGTADYAEAEPLCVGSIPLCAGAGDSASGEFEIDVPAPEDGRGVLGIKAVYKVEQDGLSVSDGIFVTVPVMSPVQTVIEAHSAVLRPGMDRDSLRRALASEFTGTLGQTYECNEISLLDILLEAIPGYVEPESGDILSLTEAYYTGVMADVVRSASYMAAGNVEKPAAFRGESVSCKEAESAGMAEALDSSLVRLAEKILACQNADGGLAWFEGFGSSPVITAVVVERMALLRDALENSGNSEDYGLDSVLKALSGAVGYLDRQMLQPSLPSWCGGVSLEQYLYVRSMYPDVTFAPGADKKALASFRKTVKEYLLPSKSIGLDGYILGKARRAATALRISESHALASWAGVSGKKLMKTVDADVASLSEYSVAHRSGGVYYPNAVMPFRGLLESEVYAHSLICDLMSRYSAVCTASSRKGTETAAADAGAIADGIRLWLMLQKENQEWGNDPAYINAVNSVLDGTENVLGTSVMALTKRYMKPFNEISAAGNGFTVVRTFYREAVMDEKDETGNSGKPGIAENRAHDAIRAGKPALVEIKEGEILHAGDKIVAEYKVWSSENRSFVRLSSPRYAALRPVQQLSGNVGGWARPLSLGGSYTFGPYAYREVKSDRTEWYMDVCPEENITFSEEFYVTQSGRFTAPAAVIESLYAPHYRANDMFGGIMTVE